MSAALPHRCKAQRATSASDCCPLRRALPSVAKPFFNRSRNSLHKSCPIPFDISLFLLRGHLIELAPMLFGTVIPHDCGNVQHQRKDQDRQNGPETTFRCFAVRSLRSKSSNEADGRARRHGDSSDRQKERRPFRRDSRHVGNKWVHREKEYRRAGSEGRERNDRIRNLLKSTDRPWYLIGRRRFSGTDAHAAFLGLLDLDARMHRLRRKVR